MTTTETDFADALSGLRERVTAPVALPGEPEYLRSNPWNVAGQITPGAVLFASTPDDVAETVRYAVANELKVTVQATGHGALVVNTDTVLVHTGAMTECVVDVDNRIARVGAGATGQHLLDAATPHGLAPVLGSSPTVGVVGLHTGGGIGPLVRSVGACADYVRAIDVVVGTGDLVRATPQQHPDLFWGLRGGKATLGIVTAMEIELLPIPEFYGGAVYFDGADAAAVLHAWREWCVGLPESITTSVALLQLPPLPGVPEPLAGRMTVAVRYVALGDVAAAERVLAPIHGAATPLVDTVGVTPYAAIGGVHADPVDPMPVYENQALLNTLSADGIDAVLALAGPTAQSLQTIVEFRMLGGALARAPRVDSALCHRDAAYSLTTIGLPMPDLAERVTAHAHAIVDALAPWSHGGQFPNFAPSTDPDRPARVYTDAVRQRLAAAGDRYDPAGVYRAGQVVRLP
ncbi:FAD-binding oxidoreductase [Mycobacterium deserti]|uniref:FAD-binding oxidoreductase n=1 Tax=Mycobacterium deserti TaxID=2978347 RepID=A0ABT2MFF4_9MYCO|nr:FAD-binding oxidoreductase [Mycobacterium deserti]MCT7661004.1 FAD-binding oxidoreductase [Mycobacterium deserti]